MTSAKPIFGSACVSKILDSILGQESQEVFVCLHLDAKHRVIGYTEVARGSVMGVAVTPSEVFRPAIVNGSVAIVISHNHPSGDPTPSADDIAVTARLLKSAKLLGIKLLDHVIVGHKKHFSFLDQGLLDSGL